MVSKYDNACNRLPFVDWPVNADYPESPCVFNMPITRALPTGRASPPGKQPPLPRGVVNFIAVKLGRVTAISPGTSVSSTTAACSARLARFRAARQYAVQRLQHMDASRLVLDQHRTGAIPTSRRSGALFWTRSLIPAGQNNAIDYGFALKHHG